MARYGYGMSVSGSKTPFVASSGAAPSGLPYSSTNSIDLVDASYPDQNGNYPKIVGFSNYTDYVGTIITNQFGTLVGGQFQSIRHYFAFNVTVNRWEFAFFEDIGGGDLVWNSTYPTHATNPSTNQNFIPTSGWSRNIVITAGV